MDLTQLAQFKLPSAGEIGLPTDSAQTLIQNVIDVIGSVAATGFLIMLIVGGFQYMTSTGNEQQVTKAKSTITSATIGLVLVVIAFPVVVFLADIFGFTSGITSGGATGGIVGGGSGGSDFWRYLPGPFRGLRGLFGG